jgi:hypothetical protein
MLWLDDEPTLEDVFSDPTVHALMERDGVDPDDLRILIENVKSALQEEGVSSTSRRHSLPKVMRLGATPRDAQATPELRPRTREGHGETLRPADATEPSHLCVEKSQAWIALATSLPRRRSELPPRRRSASCRLRPKADGPIAARGSRPFRSAYQGWGTALEAATWHLNLGRLNIRFRGTRQSAMSSRYIPPTPIYPLPPSAFELHGWTARIVFARDRQRTKRRRVSAPAISVATPPSRLHPLDR